MIENFKLWSPDKYVYIRKARTKHQLNWFFVRYTSNPRGISGIIPIKNSLIYVPKELVGKKVRLFLEVIPDKEVDSTE